MIASPSSPLLSLLSKYFVSKSKCSISLIILLEPLLLIEEQLESVHK